MSSTIHLRARGLKQTYDLAGTHLHVLTGVDLDVAKGEVLFLRGASGAGKSTLLYILAGLEHPREGTVEFEEKQLFAIKGDRQAVLRNQHMGFVFQSYFLLPELTALENVLLPAMIGGRQSKGHDAKARSLLDRVGLSGRLDHLPSQLSGGEQQRVALARAFACEPKLLLADEPTGSLDRASGELILSLMLALQAEHGSTLVLVTHDMGLASQMDQRIHLEGGRVV